MAKTILIVDDDPEARATLSRFLSSQGYNVLTSSDGKESLREIVVRRPDLVLMDVRMPNLDGLTAMETVQITGLGKKLPIILLSGELDDAVIEKGKALGAVDFLPKTTPFEELAARIKQHLGGGGSKKAA